MNLLGNLVMIRKGRDAEVLGSLFLWTEGLEHGRQETAVLSGIDQLARSRSRDAAIETRVIGDYSRLSLEHPETNDKPHFAYPARVFVDPTTGRFDADLFWSGTANWLAGWHHFFPPANQGPIVRQDGFFGRRGFLEEVERDLKRHRWVVIAAPRRYGKSSLLFALHDREGAGGSMHVDLEDLASFEHFVARVRTKLDLLDGKIGSGQEKATEGRHLRAIGSKAGTIARETRRLFGELNKRRILLLFDELGYFLQNLLGWSGRKDKAAAGAVLERMAGLRADFRNLQVVLTSSVQIVEFLRYNELDGFGLENIPRIDLPPFTPDEASRLTRALLAQRGVYGVTAACLAEILNIASPPIPYFLQILVDEVAIARRPLTPRCVREVYETHVIGAKCRRYFDQLIWHLDRYCAPEHSAAARKILNRVAVSGTPVAQSDLRHLVGPALSSDQFQILMQFLMYDCYLVRRRVNRRPCYDFNNRMMRDYVGRNPLPTL